MWRCTLLVTVLLMGVSAYDGIEMDVIDYAVKMGSTKLSSGFPNGECLSFCYLKQANQRISVKRGPAGKLKYYFEPGGAQGDLFNPYPLGYFNGYIV